MASHKKRRKRDKARKAANLKRRAKQVGREHRKEEEHREHVLGATAGRFSLKALLLRFVTKHLLIIAGVLLIVFGVPIAMKPWPAEVTIRHVIAFPGCSFARAMGIAPSQKGQPGYYERFDTDGDGWACELFQ